MLWLPKWLNIWLTPEEEDRLQDPGRRLFTFGLVGTVVSLAVPPLVLDRRQFNRVGGIAEIVSARDMRIPLQLRPGGLCSFDGIRYHHDVLGGPWLGLERSAQAINPHLQPGVYLKGLEYVRKELPTVWKRIIAGDPTLPIKSEAAELARQIQKANKRKTGRVQ